MIISFSNILHHNKVELKASNVEQRSMETAPILNREQPEAVQDSEIALNDPGCIAKANPSCSIGLSSGLSETCHF